MQVSATAQSSDFVFLEAQVPAKIAGIFRQPLTVSLGVGIAAFNAQAEGTQNALRSFQFVGEFFQFDQGLHASKELFGEDGLIQKIIGARLDSTYPVFSLAQPRDQNKGNEAR